MPHVYALVGPYFVLQSMITMMVVGPVMAAQMACSSIPGWCGGMGSKHANVKPTVAQMAAYTPENHPCKGPRVVA
jgi:hypothetical protein